MAKARNRIELECHNDLCESKFYCKFYNGPYPKEIEMKTFRVKRRTCKLFERGEKVNYGKDSFIRSRSH